MLMTRLLTFDLPLTFRFRGITRRQGVLFRGRVGWAEWSPFLDYTGEEIVSWWRAAQEAAHEEFPAPVRDEIPVNATIGTLGPEDAHARTVASGCTTAKVKVAEPGRPFAEDQARVEAVRDALGPAGKLRVDANGGWSLADAERYLRVLSRYDLEYAEQPVASVDDLASLRRRLVRAGISVPIAADESIRRADDPLRVRELDAADVAVLKVQPLGGVRACLRWAEVLGIPVVVSSALETSVGLRAGVALAAALPELPYACGLNTASILRRDVVRAPLVARDGVISVQDVVVDESLADASPDVAEFWAGRWADTETLA